MTTNANPKELARTAIAEGFVRVRLSSRERLLWNEVRDIERTLREIEKIGYAASFYSTNGETPLDVRDHFGMFFVR